MMTAAALGPRLADAATRRIRIVVQIERLVWDDWNHEHILKHAVTVEEVEAAVARRRCREDSHKNRQGVIASTVNRRILAVIIGPVPDLPDSFGVFSARPATPSERRRFAQSGGEGRP